MIILTVEEVIEAHSRLIQKTGGLNGIRDRALLESAVFNILSSFDGIEVYPSIEEKAARLMYSLVKNHSFLDGNKRIGVLAMLLTLNLNDVKLSYSQKELIELGLGTANGSLGYDKILAWIKEHEDYI